MPLTSFSANTVIASAAVNANFALAVLTDTARTVTVTHTWSASQSFTGGVSITGPITMLTAASKVVPGATSFAIRNSADSADNVLVSDAGAVTVRAGVTVTAGGLTVTAGTAAVQALTATTGVFSGGAGGASVTIPATGRLYFDGGADTYLHEVASNAFRIVVGAVTMIDIGSSSNFIAVPATCKVYLDGGADTYIHESAANTVKVVCGGADAITLTATTASFVGSVTAATGLTVTAGGLTVTAGGLTVTAGTTLITSGLLNLVGTTSSHGALKRDGTGIAVRLGDDSAYGPLRATQLIAAGVVSAAGAGEVAYGGATQTTVGGAGGASALPATPRGYILINVAGTNRVIPFFDAS